MEDAHSQWKGNTSRGESLGNLEKLRALCVSVAKSPKPANIGGREITLDKTIVQGYDISEVISDTE